MSWGKVINKQPYSQIAVQSLRCCKIVFCALQVEALHVEILLFGEGPCGAPLRKAFNFLTASLNVTPSIRETKQREG